VINEILNDGEMIVLGRVMESSDAKMILDLQIGSSLS
jgi:hypothetical protein